MKKINFKEIDYKKLAIEHCEKAVLVVFVFALLYFVKSAATAETYKTTPEELADGAKLASAHYDKSDWQAYENDLDKNPDKLRPELPKPTYQNQAETILLPPNESLYSQVPFSYPVIKPGIKRLPPALFALEEVQVSAGYGPFAIVDDMVEAPPREEQPRKEEAPKKNTGKAPPARSVAPPGGEANYPQPRTATGKGAARAINLLKANKGNPRRPSGPPGPGVEEPPGPGRNPYGPAYGRAGNLAGLLGVTVGQGAKVEGRRWVAITGAVPFHKQQEEFYAVLGSTPSNVRPEDYLQYVGFRVKRVEVSPDSSDANPMAIDWDKVPELSLDKLQGEIDSWEETPIEPVDASVIEPALCLPLPPIVGKTWDPADVVHPKIPLLKVEDLEKVAQEALEAEKKEEETKVSTAPKGMFAVKSAKRTSDELARIGASRAGPGASIVREQEYHLFRFFDFSVQTGKSYRYRVQLIANNPNYGMTEKELEKPDESKEQYKYCPWSEPTGVVSIPLDSNLLVGPAKARSASKEAEATIMVRQWNSKDGVNAVKTFKTLLRGQLSNFAKEEVHVVNPKDESTMKLTMDFSTDLMLVDFMGGERLHLRGTKVEPSEMLFVKPDGTLVMKSELKEMKDFAEESALEKSMTAPAAIEGPEAYIGGPAGDLDPLSGLPIKGKKKNPNIE